MRASARNTAIHMTLQAIGMCCTCACASAPCAHWQKRAEASGVARSALMTERSAHSQVREKCCSSLVERTYARGGILLWPEGIPALGLHSECLVRSQQTTPRPATQTQQAYCSTIVAVNGAVAVLSGSHAASDVQLERLSRTAW